MMCRALISTSWKAQWILTEEILALHPFQIGFPSISGLWVLFDVQITAVICGNLVGTQKKRKVEWLSLLGKPRGDKIRWFFFTQRDLRPVWTARRSPRASPCVAARGSLGFRPLLKSDKGGLRKPKEIDIKVTAAWAITCSDGWNHN
jgi:hypothetical protein